MIKLFSVIHSVAMEFKSNNYGKGIGALASVIGVQKQTLRNKLNTDFDTHQLKLTEFLWILNELDGNAQADVIDSLCNQFNGKFATRNNETKPNLLMAVLSGNVVNGTLSKTISDSLQDGVIDEKERAHILMASKEAMRALEVIINTLDKGESNGK